MSAARLLGDPMDLTVARRICLRVMDELAPEELDLLLELLEPLIDLAATGKVLTVGTGGNRPGGFGGADPLLASVVPAVVRVLAGLGPVAGPTSPDPGRFRVALDHAADAVARTVEQVGSRTARDRLQELVGSIRRHTFRYLLERGVEARYTDVSCPSQVAVDTPRFTAVVRLTCQPSELAAASDRLAVVPGWKVQVFLQAPDFEILSGAQREISAPSGGDSQPAVFDLRPRGAGQFRLTFDFFQQGEFLGATSAPVEVVGDKPKDPPRRIGTEQQGGPPGGRLFWEPDVPPADILLWVLHNPRGKAHTLTLISGDFCRQFEAKSPPLDPEAYAGEQFRGLALLTQEQADPSAAAILGHRRPLAPDDIDRRVKIMAQGLWRDLFPEDFRCLYAKVRGSWCGRSFLVLSDEPYIPWELVWPYGEDWEDEAPWCQTLRFSRWLCRNANGDGHERYPGRLPLSALACLAPPDSQLPAAQVERAFLTDLVQRHGLRDASPQRATWREVMNLLEKGGFDWLHVAAHGNFHALAPGQRAALWLEDQLGLTPEHIVGPGIESHLRRQRPPFVLNSCHAGRLGWSLSGLGGWASRLVSCGAGLFLGPLWAVDDTSALAFAKAFYCNLLAGEPVAEACRQARQAARCLGDPTWLAYSLYAHPNARLYLAPHARSETTQV